MTKNILNELEVEVKGNGMSGRSILLHKIMKLLQEEENNNYAIIEGNYEKDRHYLKVVWIGESK